MCSVRSFIISLFIGVVLVCATGGLTPGNGVKAQDKPTVKNARANFYEIVRQFNDNRIGTPVTRGSGYKPFRRWEWFWEPRVNRDGTFPPNDIVVKEWERFSALQDGSAFAGNWVPIGPGTPMDRYFGLGRVSCIAFHPTDTNTFWIGTPAGGIWRTDDFGKSWSTRYDNQPTLGVSDIVIDKKNPRIMYIATGDYDGSGTTAISSLNNMANGDTKSIGVMKSTDGGQSWQNTSFYQTTSNQKLISRLIASPAGSDTLFAATTDGIFKTRNKGVTWDTIQPEALAAMNYSDIVFKPGSNRVLYAASRSASVTVTGGTIDYWATIYRSDSYGNSWKKIKECKNVVRIKLAVSEQEPDILEALCVSPQCGLSSLIRLAFTDTLFTTDTLVKLAKDCGNNYLNADKDPVGAKVKDPCNGQGDYDLCYLASPVNKNERWLGGVNTWKSTNGGRNFEIANYWESADSTGKYEMAHADKHWFAFHPLQKGTFFECNDGGIYFSRDNGKKWTDITKNLQIGQIYRIAGSWQEDALMLAGFQDNGSQVLKENGKWWSTEAIGGDGMDCQVDWSDPLIRYITYMEGEIKRTLVGDWSDSKIVSNWIPDVNKKGAWITPFIIDPADPAIIYAGYDKIWKTTKRGDSLSWTPVMTHPANEIDKSFRVLAISQYDQKVMWASTGSKLYRTKNGWSTWDTISFNKLRPIGKYMVTGIAIHPTRPDTVFVTFSGYDSLKVYRTGDGGDTWTNISGKNLPLVPVNCIAYEDFTNDALYIGTDVGVFYRNADLTDWIPFSKDLPNIMVTDLEIGYGTGKIRASTYGRGAWESDLYVASGKYKVNVKDIPKQGGDVTGGGTFPAGAKAILTAKPEPGYKFEGWFEKGVKLSDSLTYVFKVDVNHNIVGKFGNPAGIESKLKSQITLFPNPTKGLVEIRMEGQLQNDLGSVRVISMQGTLVYESKAKLTDDHLLIDLSAYSNGPYIVTLYFTSGDRVSYTVMLSR